MWEKNIIAKLKFTTKEYNFQEQDENTDKLAKQKLEAISKYIQHFQHCLAHTMHFTLYIYAIHDHVKKR